MQYSNYQNTRCILKNEQGEYLIDQGRILLWTNNKKKATVYTNETADIKIINWPNTHLIKEYPAKKQCPPKKPTEKSDVPELILKVKALNLTAWQLEKASGIEYRIWTNFLQDSPERRSKKTENKIRSWLLNR